MRMGTAKGMESWPNTLGTWEMNTKYDEKPNIIIKYHQTNITWVYHFHFYKYEKMVNLQYVIWMVASTFFNLPEKYWSILTTRMMSTQTELCRRPDARATVTLYSPSRMRNRICFKPPEWSGHVAIIRHLLNRSGGSIGHCFLELVLLIFCQVVTCIKRFWPDDSIPRNPVRSKIARIAGPRNWCGTWDEDIVSVAIGGHNAMVVKC